MPNIHHEGAEPKDEELVAQVLDGNTGAFELLMRRHNARVFRTARAIVKDDTEAEDVMQEAYVRAFRHLKDFEGRARFSTWLTRIAVHEALAKLRKKQAREPFDGPFRAEDDGGEMATNESLHNPETIAANRELARAIENAIDDLPASFRAVFVLRAVEQLSGAEVAETLGIPEETVKTRLFRARATIQRRLIARTDALTPSVYDFHLSRCDRVVESVLQRLTF